MLTLIHFYILLLHGLYGLHCVTQPSCPLALSCLALGCNCLPGELASPQSAGTVGCRRPRNLKKSYGTQWALLSLPFLGCAAGVQPGNTQVGWKVFLLSLRSLVRLQSSQCTDRDDMSSRTFIALYRLSKACCDVLLIPGNH